MQDLVLAAIALVFAIVAVVATVSVLDRRGRITRLQVALGSGIGLVGAFFVLVSLTDLIPDGPEDSVQRIVVVVVTVAAALGSWYRIARV